MRIILADHHEQPLWALKAMVDEEPDFELVGSAVNAKGLLELSNDQHAELILMDYELPGMNIEEMIDRLRRLKPRPIIVVMSSELHNSQLILRLRADDFVSKADEPDWLVEKLKNYAVQVKEKHDTYRNK